MPMNPQTGSQKDFVGQPGSKDGSQIILRPSRMGRVLMRVVVHDRHRALGLISSLQVHPGAYEIQPHRFP